MSRYVAGQAVVFDTATDEYLLIPRELAEATADGLNNDGWSRDGYLWRCVARKVLPPLNTAS